jgi:mono/diheme cytochrome c family protein
MATIGQNPADDVTVVLEAYKDPNTLAWLDAPGLPLPPSTSLPVDVPLWWRMAKQHAMFYNAEGRGDHSRYMMLASMLCTDSVAEAAGIWSYFADIEAYITSITPPPFPFSVDAALAAQGATVFASNCSSCHGSYEAAGAYPNLVIPTKEVGTDPLLAQGTAYFSTPYQSWFEASFYGQTAKVKPEDGYYAPPLDGIWATAPYLHNGSVPTLAALLDSQTRPKYWTRSFDSNDYDPSALGWRYTALDHGQTSEPDAATRARIYDTTLYGSSSGGHTYGDGLSAPDRRAVIEYLKTL